MKHAGPSALGRIATLLAKLRKRPALREKKTGIFYRKSKAYLHFHEDPTGIFADVRFGKDFTRLPATTAVEQRALLAAVDADLART